MEPDSLVTNEKPGLQIYCHNAKSKHLVNLWTTFIVRQFSLTFRKRYVDFSLLITFCWISSWLWTRLWRPTSCMREKRLSKWRRSTTTISALGVGASSAQRRANSFAWILSRTAASAFTCIRTMSTTIRWQWRNYVRSLVIFVYKSFQQTNLFDYLLR